MQDIFNAAVQYGKEKDGYTNLVKGANIAGFMKVANAMCDLGLVYYFLWTWRTSHTGCPFLFILINVPREVALLKLKRIKPSFKFQ